jgi:prepilin-type processing-associated H-X9-DG protein
MPKTSKRANVKNLKTVQELTPKQAKRVKGGSTPHPGGINVAMGDGSVRNIADGTSNTLLLPAVKK